MSYIDVIKDKARMDRRTIVLPETTDKRTLIAASHIIQEGIANIIMIGDPEKIMDGATWLEIDLEGVKIVNPLHCDKLDEYVNLLYETRKNKGMTLEKARDILLSDPLTFGVIMVKANDADGMVAGACHATADTLRPALQILKTAPGVKLVSGFFLMCIPDCEFGENGTFLFADCGLNQDPTAEELAAIADTSSRSFKYDLPPRCRVPWILQHWEPMPHRAAVLRQWSGEDITHGQFSLPPPPYLPAHALHFPWWSGLT